MNRSDFTANLCAIHERRTGLLLTKGHDYANEDMLSNFKNVGRMLNVSSFQVAYMLMMVKLDRWRNLTEGDKKPKNESVMDTVCDLHNYIDLAYACQKEDK